MWYRCNIIGAKGNRNNCADNVLGSTINTVLQQQLHHLDMAYFAGPVQWCLVKLGDDASPGITYRYIIVSITLSDRCNIKRARGRQREVLH